jgi:hypothetical protein
MISDSLGPSMPRGVGICGTPIEGCIGGCNGEVGGTSVIGIYPRLSWARSSTAATLGQLIFGGESFRA